MNSKKPNGPDSEFLLGNLQETIDGKGREAEAHIREVIKCVEAQCAAADTAIKSIFMACMEPLRDNNRRFIRTLGRDIMNSNRRTDPEQHEHTQTTR